MPDASIDRNWHAIIPATHLMGATAARCVPSDSDRTRHAARAQHPPSHPAGSRPTGTTALLHHRGATMSRCSRDTRHHAFASHGNGKNRFSPNNMGDGCCLAKTHVPVLLRPPDFDTPSVSCLNGGPPHKLSRLVMMRPRNAVMNSSVSAAHLKHL